MSFISKLFVALGLWSVAVAGWALSPILQLQDLMAGEGEPGYEDGAFYSAQFSGPLGLALDAGVSFLYVADSGNQRVRRIDLSQKNMVSTLAGTGKVGKEDGPLTVASFSRPTGLAMLPNGQIAVNDQGNSLLRLIDLKAQVVSTLALDGDAAQASFSRVWNMAYCPLDQCLYFSQPEAGVLRKLDLNSLKTETVLKENPSLPHPAALCWSEGKLYVADKAATQVYAIRIEAGKKAGKASPTPVPSSPVSLEPVGSAHDVLALAVSGKALYAYQADPKAPLFRLFPAPGALTFASVWGERMINPSPGAILPLLNGVAPTDAVGFIADPRSDGRFFAANPTYAIIGTLRDLRLSDSDFSAGEDKTNSAGIHDLEYPYRKPEKTYRILVIGRSYLYWVANDRQYEQKGLEGERSNLMTTLAKKMELELNTRSALEDSPVHYEVLNGGMHSGSNEINVWSYYQVPALAEKYDIDLVLIMSDGYLGYNSFFESPLTKEGIPSKDVDPEYVLKPNAEKFKSGAFHDFLELCKAKNLLVVHSPTVWTLDMDSLLGDADLRGRFLDLADKPLILLRQKMAAMKTSGGNTRRLEVCQFPIPNLPSKKNRALWKELCLRTGIPSFDITDEVYALGLSYYPYGAGHYTLNGMGFLARIVVDELLRGKKIPF